MGKFIEDILVVCGCGLILVGVYKFIPEATWFVGGAMLVLAGLVYGAGNRKTK